MPEPQNSRVPKSIRAFTPTRYGPQPSPEDDSTAPPTEGSVEEAAQAWRTSGKPEDLARTLQHLQPTIDSAVRAHTGGSQSQVVKDRARLLAIEAVRAFSPEKGLKLPHYVYGHLQQLRQLAPQINDPLPAPARLQRDRAAVLRASQDLQDRLGRSVTDEEIAQHGNLDVKKVRAILRGGRRGIAMSSYEGRQDGDSGADIVGSQRTPEDDWMEAVDSELSPHDQLILRHRTGYQDHEILPNHEIARRLNLTPSAVSQRAQRIQAKLDQYHG